MTTQTTNPPSHVPPTYLFRVTLTQKNTYALYVAAPTEAEAIHHVQDRYEGSGPDHFKRVSSHCENIRADYVEEVVR